MGNKRMNREAKATERKRGSGPAARDERRPKLERGQRTETMEVREPEKGGSGGIYPPSTARIIHQKHKSHEQKPDFRVFRAFCGLNACFSWTEPVFMRM